MNWTAHFTGSWGRDFCLVLVLAFAMVCSPSISVSKRARPKATKTKKRKRSTTRKAHKATKKNRVDPLLEGFAKRKRRRWTYKRYLKRKYKKTRVRTKPEPALSKEQIAWVVRHHIYMFRFCYEGYLRKHPSHRIYGANLGWIIGPKGTVTKAWIKSKGPNSSTYEACMIQALKKLKFPKPRGGATVTVNYPWFLCRSG